MREGSAMTGRVHNLQRDRHQKRREENQLDVPKPRSTRLRLILMLSIRPRRYSSSDRNDDDDDRGDATDDFPAILSTTRADFEEIGGRGVVLGFVVERRREVRRDEMVLALRHARGLERA